MSMNGLYLPPWVADWVATIKSRRNELKSIPKGEFRYTLNTLGREYVSRNNPIEIQRFKSLIAPATHPEYIPQIF